MKRLLLATALAIAGTVAGAAPVSAHANYVHSSPAADARLVKAPTEVRIQFSELAKLTGDRADALRRQILGYVHRIATIIEAGQADGTFVDIPPMTQALLILAMSFFSSWRAPSGLFLALCMNSLILFNL